MARPPHPPLTYRDRESGRLVDEVLSNERAMRWAYETSLGGAAFHLFYRWGLYSRLVGYWQDRPASRRRIAPFVATFGIDPDELELPLDGYSTFAAFFERRLRPGARPFPEQAERLASPGDGKLLVVPTLGEDTLLPVKGRHVPVGALVADAGAAARYRGGSALVLRLAPSDYHRFHFIDEGVASAASSIAGRYFSVNPIALASKPDIFLRNHRMVSVQDTRHFGHVAYVEVGACEVGRIVQTYVPGPVSRGQEKGTFRPGGSTVVLLFEPGRVAFDPDLIEASAQALETHVKAGSAIGTAPRRT